MQVVESQAVLEAAVVHASAGILVPADWEKELAEGRRPEMTVLLNLQAGTQTELATLLNRLLRFDV